MPEVTYFKPAGIPLRALEEVRLSIEEVEAIRLKDMEGFEQESSIKHTLAGICQNYLSALLLAVASFSTVKSTNMPIENGGLTLP